jgi:hypothetical protein
LYSHSCIPAIDNYRINKMNEKIHDEGGEKQNDTLENKIDQGRPGTKNIL